MKITEKYLQKMIAEEVLKEMLPDIIPDIGGLSSKEQEYYLPKLFRTAVGQDALRNITKCVSIEMEKLYDDIAKGLGVK